MVHQDGHGLVKLAILIWLTDLLIMPTKQPTYLLTYLYLPIYLPSIYLCHIYLLLCTYYLPKLFIHLPIYLHIYLPSQVPTNLLIKKMSLCTLTKKFMEVQRYMLNPFGIILFYKVVQWFDGQNIGVEPKKPRFNSFYQHILCGIYIFVYISCTCM